MKKKPKGRQNWFKIQFKKHPYLFKLLIGWVVIISVAGSSGYTGACILAVKSALISGAGILKVLVPESLSNLYDGDRVGSLESDVGSLESGVDSLESDVYNMTDRIEDLESCLYHYADYYDFRDTHSHDWTYACP